MKTRRSKFLMGLLIIVIVVLAIIGWSAVRRKTLIGKAVTITRVTIRGEKTPTAALAVPYSRDQYSYDYLNTAIDLNKDGKFAAYQVDGKTQQEWIVQNMAARVRTQEGNSFGFQLLDPAADDRHNFPTVVMLTNSPVTQWDGRPRGSAASRSLTVTSITEDEIGDRMRLTPAGTGDTGPVSGNAAPDNREVPNQPPSEGAGRGQGAPAPEVQKLQPPPADIDVFHANVPDITQAVNECVPTSTTNSLLWMGEQYDFKDKLPATAADIITELKQDMHWDQNGVVTDTHFLPGKEAFVKRHKLPLVTHKISDQQFDLTIMKKIAAELEKGQDVELVLEFGHYDAQGHYARTGGHMVTTVGVRQTGQAFFIELHDPLSPGPEKLDIYQVDGTRVIDYRYQGQDVTYIRLAIAESPIESPAATPPAKNSTTAVPRTTANPAAESDSSTTTVTKTLRPKTYSPSDYYDATHVSMKVLLLDGVRYPLYQFYGYTDASVCSAPYYSSSMVGIPVYSMDFDPKQDPDPTGCGFGQIGKRTVDRVILTGDEFTELSNKIQHLRFGN